MIRQTDAKGQVTTQFHDALGRLIERREYPGDTTTTPFVTVWSFDQYADGGTCTQGIGKLCETRSATLARGATIGGALDLITSVTGGNHSVARSTQYDAYGRAERQITELREPGSTAPTLRRWVSATSYDSESRPDKTTYPSGFTLANRYTAWSGALDQVSEWANGQVHWKATGRHLDGQIAGMELGGTATLGSGINVSKTYDGFGRVSGIYAGGSSTIQNATFTFDALGNLIGRGDAPNGQASETFGYDLLNRLTTRNGVNVASYYADGRLNTRSGVSGTYGYQTGTHRVNSAGGYSLGYDNNGNVTTLTGNGADKTLTYLAFNLPSRIAAEGNTLDYRYDAAHARLKETAQTQQGSSSTYYLGAFEEHARNDGVVELRHYLLTPEGAVGIVTRRSNAQDDTRYWFKDHLGSIVASTDGAGTARQRFTYDPWGKRSVVPIVNADPNAEERGFTGHEHLTEAGLIHMNGRLYFDALGRMLQADPIIQAPYDGQNYDRYAYVFNNPLSFIDPTGYSAWTRIRAPVAAIIVTIMTAGAMTAAAMAAGASTTFATVTLSAFGIEGASLSITGAMIAGAAGGFAAGGISSGNIEGALQGALQGAAFGALNFGIGHITTGAGNVFGEYAKAANVALHAVVGCAQSAAAGGSCKGGAVSGGFSAAAGAVGLGGGVVGRAVVGAMASKLAGGRAGDGAMVAAFDYLFNDMAHEMSPDGSFRSDGDTAYPTDIGEHTKQFALGAGVTLAVSLGPQLAVAALLDASGATIASVTSNRIAGNLFRDEIASLLEKQDYQVAKEVYKKTPLGKRFIDIEVSKGGVVLGGIETKWGNAVYSAAQQAKDMWLRLRDGYIVNVVRP